MGSATGDERERRNRCSRSQASSAATGGHTLFPAYSQTLFGALAVDAAFDIEQGVDGFTVSRAIGEIAVAFLPRRALAAISASSKNCLRACAHHRAAVQAPSAREGS